MCSSRAANSRPSARSRCRSRRNARLAVDPVFIPLGVPLWLDTTLPDTALFRRLVFAQDTGGAIKGPVRADVFFGFGPEAEQLAGNMKSPGRVFVLLPAKREVE